jgi:hypothetical protein
VAPSLSVSNLRRRTLNPASQSSIYQIKGAGGKRG